MQASTRSTSSARARTSPTSSGPWRRSITPRRCSSWRPTSTTSEYLDAAGDAADGTFVRTAIWPFEEADENPATQRYLDIVDATDGKVAVLGVQSMSAWLLFADGGQGLRPRIEPDPELRPRPRRRHHVDWDGGGLHAPTQPGDQRGVRLRHRPPGRRRGVRPAHARSTDYHCDPEDIVDRSDPRVAERLDDGPVPHVHHHRSRDRGAVRRRGLGSGRHLHDVRHLQLRPRRVRHVRRLRLLAVPIRVGLAGARRAVVVLGIGAPLFGAVVERRRSCAGSGARRR